MKLCMSRREGKCQAGNSDEMNPTSLLMIESGLMRLLQRVSTLLRVYQKFYCLEGILADGISFP